MRVPLICCLLLALLAPPVRAQETPAGFTSLFNGKDLSGWEFLNCKKEDWVIEKGGVLSTRKEGPRKNQWILTESYFDDFELRLEFLVTKGAASGLTIRAEGGTPVADSIKIHLGDDDAFPVKLGALWDVKAPDKSPAKVGQWN